MNIQEIRTGDPEKIRRALGFLLEVAPYARDSRAIIEDLQNHEDLDIANRARNVLAAMRAEDAAATD